MDSLIKIFIDAYNLILYKDSEAYYLDMSILGLQK